MLYIRQLNFNSGISSEMINRNFRSAFNKRFFVLFVLIALNSTTISADNSSKPILSKNGIVAYTWNANPSASTSTLSTSLYTFNNGHSVTRDRPSTGVYKVKFKELACNRGQFIVNAYGGTNYKSCRIGSWNGKKDCEVSVYCFNLKGEPLDSQFNLLFVD